MQKKVPYVAQLGNMDCSIACMTMLFRYYGLDVDIVDVGQVVHIGRDGVNLTQLKQATQQFGFKCTAYRYNKQKNILDSNLPAVVYSGSHLAVIGSKTVLGQYILLDPIKGKSIVNFEQIHDTFSDILITIRPEKRIKRKKCKPKLKVAINYKLVAGIISLMLLIQALTLSIPLVEQALIDSITQSQSLLNSAYILVGCIVIAGLYFFLSIARQKLMLRLDISFVKEIMTKMLKKLFDIDPSFFEWHAVGEIVNRFSNVQAINNIIINTFSQVAVQIITSTICLVTMFVYSPSLSVITIAIGTIELVLLLGINKKNREDTSKYIADQSNMQGLLAEAIGNIIEIRCMGMEKAIYKNLTNQFLDELESFRKKSNTGNQMLAISSTITLIFPLIIYILGYSSVVNEALTIGQLIAYVTLANYFISPFVSIVIALPNLNFVYEVFLRYKELITYRETHKNGVIGGQQFEELYLANVSFSYNHSLNQKVLNDISLHIRPQELCAIVGFSGSGKSTLLKIILGLLSPDVGTVKINSIKANDFSHDRMYEMTLTHIDKQPPAETNTHKIKENKDGDYASKNDIIRAIKFIADQLLEEAVLSEDNKDANWLGVKLVGDYGHGSLSIRPLDVYLYEGVAGICIFFAAISRYYSNYELQRVLSAATKSLFDYTEDILQREGNHIDSSGVFGGESSLVYSYSLLYQLTRNPEYLKYAEKHFPIIERAVQYDQAFDVVYGNAGAILALINLYSLKRDKRYLNCAKTAAKVICDAQQKGGGWKAATVSAPLAGFSHGVAGIVYALNKLYKLYPDKHIKQCIVNGLQYEDELFCEADGNWKDIRKGSTNGKNLCAWCHGAGGILLSRISLLGNIDNETDEIVKEDIRNAVKTMQSHKYLQNPCVCHGIAGNAEILLTYGQQFQDQIASSTAKHFYSRLVGSVNSGTFECSRPYLYGFNIPGFMTGLAGIGYSLLRLLDPTLPSVLQINI